MSGKPIHNTLSRRKKRPRQRMSAPAFASRLNAMCVGTGAPIAAAISRTRRWSSGASSAFRSKRVASCQRQSKTSGLNMNSTRMMPLTSGTRYRSVWKTYGLSSRAWFADANQYTPLATASVSSRYRTGSRSSATATSSSPHR